MRETASERLASSLDRQAGSRILKSTTSDESKRVRFFSSDLSDNEESFSGTQSLNRKEKLVRFSLFLSHIFPL